MRTILAVKSVMTPFPYAIEIDAALAEAQHLMREHQVRHRPVVKEHELVGVLSDRDIKLLLGPVCTETVQSKLAVRHVGRNADRKPRTKDPSSRW